MSDECFDLCECIWSSEYGLQRLLEIARQTQSYCTDTECMNIPRLPVAPSLASASIFGVIFVLGITALFAFRPNSWRSLENNVNASDKRTDSNNQPPTPPPATN